MIVNYDSSIVNKFGASLTDNAIVVIYNHYMFTVQATAYTRDKDCHLGSDGATLELCQGCCPIAKMTKNHVWFILVKSCRLAQPKDRHVVVEPVGLEVRVGSESQQKFRVYKESVLAQGKTSLILKIHCTKIKHDNY
jgi:hypothetical protein